MLDSGSGAAFCWLLSIRRRSLPFIKLTEILQFKFKINNLLIFIRSIENFPKTMSRLTPHCHVMAANVYIQRVH